MKIYLFGHGRLRAGSLHTTHAHNEQSTRRRMLFAVLIIMCVAVLFVSSSLLSTRSPKGAWIFERIVFPAV